MLLLGNDQFRGARVASQQSGLGSNPGVNAIYGVEFVVGFLPVLRLSCFLKNQPLPFGYLLAEIQENLGCWGRGGLFCSYYHNPLIF